VVAHSAQLALGHLRGLAPLHQEAALRTLMNNLDEAGAVHDALALVLGRRHIQERILNPQRINVELCRQTLT